MNKLFLLRQQKQKEFWQIFSEKPFEECPPSNVIYEEKGGGFVYLFKSSDNLIKIGRSKKPFRRKTDIQCELKIKVLEVFVSPCLIRYGKLEKRMHRNHKDTRKFGEWFELTMSEAINSLEKEIERYKTKSK